MKKTILLLTLLFLGISLQAQTANDSIHALFIGNSYTAYNGMAYMVRKLAHSQDKKLVVRRLTRGGAYMRELVKDERILKALREEQWNFVVFQEQSRAPAAEPEKVEREVYTAAYSLDSLRREHQPNAKSYFYMTWGRNNDEYDDVQRRLSVSYLEMARRQEATCAPVGLAWQRVRHERPDLPLHNPDKSHPTPLGSYLTACVFYCTFFNEPCESDWYDKLSKSDALYLQRIATEVVMGHGNRWKFQEKDVRRVSVLCYNVHNCIGLDKKRDYNRIARTIIDAAPDVVALQELDSVTQRNNGVYALGELARITGLHPIFAPAINFSGGKYGIGVLCREVPLSHRIVPMPGREEERALLIVEFKEYVFCCTHQSLTAADQEASVQLIAEALQGIEKPIILAGDMNSTPKDKAQKKLRKLFTPLTPANVCTFPADKPDRVLDYIYGYRKNGYKLTAEKTQVIYEPVASDHRPIQTLVRIESK